MIGAPTILTTMGYNALQKYQKPGVRLVPERCDGVRVFAQHCLDNGCRAITMSNPDHAGIRARDLATFLKIGIFGDNRKAIPKRVAPNGIIGGAVKARSQNVR